MRSQSYSKEKKELTTKKKKGKNNSYSFSDRVMKELEHSKNIRAKNKSSPSTFQNFIFSVEEEDTESSNSSKYSEVERLLNNDTGRITNQND